MKHYTSLARYIKPSLYIFIAVFFIGCSKKATAPVMDKTSLFENKNLASDIVVNYRLEKAAITDTFNRAIDEIFKANFDIPDYDIKLSLKKPKSAAVEIEGKNMLVIIPVDINVTKSTFLTDLKAKGTLEMTFVTELDVDSLWNFKTKTSLSYQRWIDKPKLSVFGINLPVETIANVVINKTKHLIVQNIDESVKQNFTLSQKMKEIFATFDQPIQMDDASFGWMSFIPQSVYMSKITNSRFSAIGKIQIKATTAYSTYKPQPKNTSAKLPKMYWSDQIKDSSEVQIVTDIQMMDINQYIKKNLDGQTFTQGGNTMKLSNIVTNCDYEYIRVITDVEGTVNGMLIIKGIPKFDKAKGEIYTSIVDIQFKTKNKLHKAAAWIAEGKIKKELESNIKFSINESIKEVQNTIDTEMETYSKANDMDLVVKIGSASLMDYKLKPGQIEAIFNTKFKIDVGIKNFKTFNRY